MIKKLDSFFPDDQNHFEPYKKWLNSKRAELHVDLLRIIEGQNHVQIKRIDIQLFTISENIQDLMETLVHDHQVNDGNDEILENRMNCLECYLEFVWFFHREIRTYCKDCNDYYS